VKKRVASDERKTILYGYIFLATFFFGSSAKKMYFCRAENISKQKDRWGYSFTEGTTTSMDFNPETKAFHGESFVFNSINSFNSFNS
jgi:hypothetical protein